jgi:type IV pilus assembly protein PilE
MKKKLNGFSLTELLIVLAIVGILTLIALPNFMPKISEAKAQEAKLHLKHLYTLQEAYFYVNSKYSTNLDEIGFIQEKTVENDGNANYIIRITSASNTSFTATATAVVDFNKNGEYNVWEIDQDLKLKEITRD